LLFSVGGTQLKVTLVLVVGVCAGGGVVVVVVVVEPDVPEPEVLELEPEVPEPEPDVDEPEVVEPVEPLVALVELLLVGAVSATVVGVVELVVAVLALLVASLDTPESAPPHPASAIAVLPNNVNPTKRPTRADFCMHYPEYVFSPGQGEVIIRKLHESAAELQLAFHSRGGSDAPATPLS
jgi:hypothetical protein